MNAEVILQAAPAIEDAYGTEIEARAVRVRPMVERLEGMTVDERTTAYVQFNCWVWPDALSDIKPDGWDGLSNDQKFHLPEAKELFAALLKTTDNKQRSRAWWVKSLKRTVAEHEEWYARQETLNSTPRDLSSLIFAWSIAAFSATFSLALVILLP